MLQRPPAQRASRGCCGWQPCSVSAPSLTCKLALCTGPMPASAVHGVRDAQGSHPASLRDVACMLCRSAGTSQPAVEPAGVDDAAPASATDASGTFSPPTPPTVPRATFPPDVTGPCRSRVGCMDSPQLPSSPSPAARAAWQPAPSSLAHRLRDASPVTAPGLTPLQNHPDPREFAFPNPPGPTRLFTLVPDSPKYVPAARSPSNPADGASMRPGRRPHEDTSPAQRAARPRLKVLRLTEGTRECAGADGLSPGSARSTSTAHAAHQRATGPAGGDVAVQVRTCDTTTFFVPALTRLLPATALSKLAPSTALSYRPRSRPRPARAAARHIAAARTAIATQTGTAPHTVAAIRAALLRAQQARLLVRGRRAARDNRVPRLCASSLWCRHLTAVHRSREGRAA